MRLNPIPLIAAVLFAGSMAAQTGDAYTVYLKSGNRIPEENITTARLDAFNNLAARTGKPVFSLVQFNKIPADGQRTALAQAGIQLLDYIPNNAFTALISQPVVAEQLLQWDIRSLAAVTPAQKMLPALHAGIFPAHAVKIPGTADLWITYVQGYSFEEVIKELRENNFDIQSTLFKNYRTIAVRINAGRLHELAAMPFIEHVDAAPGEMQWLNNYSRVSSRANVLSKETSIGGRGLKGSGITVGIGDNADPVHVDFSGRLISRAAAPANYHGTHVHGTAGGAGIWNELYTGHAPKARLISQVGTGIWINAAAYYSDYRMVITNNSYGNVTTDCAYSGFYDNYSRFLDVQAFSLPKVLNTFAAGNSGIGFPINCSPFPAGYKSVVGGMQASKNTLTIGNTMSDGVIFPQSSRGPVKDGRLKPEIVAQGSFVVSTSTFADYAENTGTSMANPAVTGTLALLYERYRQLNGPATDPDNALMKAILCNTATDRGNPGPDYIYGFGWMNGLRAVEALEAGNYQQNSINTGGDNTFDINVPANTAQLKVMLYWNDPAAAPSASKALVNDLDLRLTTTAPATYLPLILDSSATGVSLPAQPGVDGMNNIEQVTVDNPTGIYTVHVSGTAVPVSAPQTYYVTYDIVPVSSRLIFPTGGEKLIPNDLVLVSWDAFGGSAETFTVEFSTDNGGSWSTLSNNVPASQRYFVWTIPNSPTNQARIRLTKNNTALVSTSDAFTILGAPTVSLSAVQCEGYIAVDWTAVPAATQYEVMKLQGDEMVSVATVSNAVTSYTIGGLSKDTVYWITVRAINGGFAGRRPKAVFRQPNNGTCAGTLSDNDLKLEAILSPAGSGRRFTSTGLGAAITVTIRIKNLDDAPSSGNIDVSYSINGVPQQTQTIAPAIAAGATYDHSFTTTADLSPVGTYSITVSANTVTDPITANNSLTRIFKQLDNQPVSLPFTDNFDAAPEQSFNTAQTGLQNLDRYDFVNNTIYGRVRTFINSGMSYSGVRALTLDAERYNAGGNIDSLTGTYNIDLTGYNPATEEIRLDFRYKNHGQVTHAANKVWIRGSDADSWKEAYDLFANQNPVDGTYKLSSSIELSDLLDAVPVQTFTPSFQVRWGQYGQNQAADNDGGGGYTFDDIRLYKVTDDMQLISINAPAESSCGLTAATPVSITVRNSRNSAVPAVPGVPVRYRINGGAWVSETVPGIPANTAQLYTFTTTADFSANGNYLIEAEVLYPSDNFDDNDTLSKRITNSPVITGFPYLEDFELSSGSWYAAGKLNTWEYGTPASNKIVSAASGSKAWKTRSVGGYNDNELSYLNSPCFDVSGMTNPTLSFSLAFDIEDCGATLCDGAYMEYSLDGITWARLGANGQGTNWYNKTYTGNHLWSSETYSRWHVATIPLTVTGAPIATMNRIRFRFVMAADAGLYKDGIAVDDIHVYDNINGIYDGATMGAPVTQLISTGINNWVDFLQGGKLVASVHPGGQEMGSTNVQAFINAAPVRYTSTQYYHDRNITIQPGVSFLTLADSVWVRFYFLDTETEALINATGCPACYKPTSGYALGVSKYSDPDNNFENGTILDDNQGVWTFINAAKARKVPFDKGYYAEFKVNNFSEFWLNNGGFNNDTPLPVQLVSFNARKKTNSTDVLAEWITASEYNVSRFEVEVARGNREYQLGRFVKAGEVQSAGNSVTEQRYTFTDMESNKTGVRYYRLKIIDRDGSSRYSEVRPVVFNNEIKWQVNPNPSKGVFSLLLQATAGETIGLKLYDVQGRLIREQPGTADGFVQKIQLDISASRYAAGLYLLEASAGGSKETFRLIKQ